MAVRLREFAAAHGVPERSTFRLALALEESASNIVTHALRRDPAKTFQAVLERTRDAFVIELRDDGPEFDPTADVPDRRCEKDEDDLPGGWGIELVRRNVDEIRHGREGISNVLRLTTYLAPASDGG